MFISNTEQLEIFTSEFEAAATGTYYDGKLGKFTEITVLEGDGLGDWTYDDEDIITLTNSSDEKYGSSYRMTYKFINRNEILNKTGDGYKDRELAYFYMRVAYKTDNGSGDNVSLVTVNPKNDITATLAADVANTNGEWVLSDAVRVPTDILNALSGTGTYDSGSYEELYQLPAVLAFTNTADDASYSVKNIYFFKTADDAISFTMPADEEKPASKYTFGGTTYDRAEYTTVVDDTLADGTYKLYVEDDILYLLGNTADNGLYLVSNISDYWRTDADVSSYFINKYGNEANFKAQNGGITYSMLPLLVRFTPVSTTSKTAITSSVAMRFIASCVRWVSLHPRRQQ